MKLTRRSLLSGVAAPAILQQPKNKPNILFLLSDDHSYPYLGVYGARWMSTPTLDRLAAEGLRFDRMFTSSPQCVPSRAAFMTGQSPVAVRVGRFNTPLPPDVKSLPEYLRELGYYTGVCGRYFHLDGVIKAGPITQRVYEKYGLKTWNKRVDYLDVSPQGQTPARFREFLSRVPRNTPWFLWINFSDPHHVWDKDAGHVNPAAIELPPHLPDLPGVREDLARYCGEIERLDSLVAENLEVLRKSGQEENTLVLFAGDNGMAFPHGKGSLYDPGLHVPLIVRWPGRGRTGVTDALISGEDLAPTFIEAAGGKPPERMTGRSFLGLITGGSYQPRKSIFAQRLHHGNQPFTANTKSAGFDLGRCVRSDRWKLIYNCTPYMEYQPTDSARDPSWQQIVQAHAEGKLPPAIERAYFQRPRPVIELYDLAKDPGELNNLAGDPNYKAVQEELIAALTEKMIIDFDFLPPPTAD
jgi:arylsulfatase A-like enzyme